MPLFRSTELLLNQVVILMMPFWQIITLQAWTLEKKKLTFQASPVSFIVPALSPRPISCACVGAHFGGALKQTALRGCISRKNSIEPWSYTWQLSFKQGVELLKTDDNDLRTFQLRTHWTWSVAPSICNILINRCRARQTPHTSLALSTFKLLLPTAAYNPTCFITVYYQVYNYLSQFKPGFHKDTVHDLLYVSRGCVWVAKD